MLNGPTMGASTVLKLQMSSCWGLGEARDPNGYWVSLRIIKMIWNLEEVMVVHMNMGGRDPATSERFTVGTRTLNPSRAALSQTRC